MKQLPSMAARWMLAGAIILVAWPAMAEQPDRLLQSIAVPPPGVQSAAQLGYSVAVDGKYIVAGAPLDDLGGLNAGVVKVFDATTGALLYLLTNPNPKPNAGPGIRINFGSSVAISGMRVVVGAPDDDLGVTFVGRAYVFDLSSSTPTVPVLTLENPSPGQAEFFGRAVAISGSRVAVGVPNDRNVAPNAGLVHIYDLGSATPAAPVLTLTGTSNRGERASARFGDALALSGTLMAVGAPSEDTGADGAGAAYLYDLGNGTPTSPLTRLNNPAPAQGGEFGHSVSIAGSRVVVGLRSHHTGVSGDALAYVYDVTSGTPGVPALGLTSPGLVATDLPTPAVISGTHVIVGAYRDDAGGKGNAYLYDLSGSQPTKPMRTLPNPGAAANDSFATALAISGTSVVIGAPYDDKGATDAGSVYAYEIGGAASTTPIATFSNPSPVAVERLAFAISGTRLLAGGFWDDTGATNAGRAYVHDLASATPTVAVATLNNPSPEVDDNFGLAVALSGVRAAVGAPKDNTGAPDAGSAYIYDLSSGTPSMPVATLNNPNPNVGDSFGDAVAISGPRLVVGARSNDMGAIDAGSAYVYDLSSAAPTTPVATLDNPSPSSGDLFGYAVAISGTLVVVGAPYDDTGAANAGTAYVYDLSNGTASIPIAVLNNPSPAPNDFFGNAVAISGLRVAVGAYGSALTDGGSVYLYDLASGSPTVPIATLSHPSPSRGDGFGYSVAISGLRVVIGAGSVKNAFVYDFGSETPTAPVATLETAGPVVANLFGTTVALDGLTAGIGSAWDTTAYIFKPGTPEIAVERQPSATVLTDAGTQSFGSVLVNTTASLTFTVKNVGTASLTGLATTIDGPNAAEFILTSTPTGPLSAAGGATTFTVQFAPNSLGAKAAALHLSSNDSDENPFDIGLTGTSSNIASQPVSQVVEQGAPVTFSVEGGGIGSSFQWRKDGVDIPGAVASSFSIPSAQPWQIGNYSVLVTNGVGSTVSEPASLGLTGVPSELWRGLVACYPFNGSPEDLCRPGKPATLVNTAELIWDPQRGGVARIRGKGWAVPFFEGEPPELQGPGGYLQIPRPPLVDGDPFTVSFVIKEEGFSLWHGETLFTMGEGAASNDVLSHFWVGSIGGSQEIYGGPSQTVQPYSSNYVLEGDGAAVTVTSPWTTYTAVGDGNIVRLYRNGQLMGDSPYKKETSGDSFIGRHWWENGARFSTRLRARVDDVRIYNRALTPQEILQVNALTPTPSLAEATDWNRPWSSGSTGSLPSSPTYWGQQSIITADGIDAVEGGLDGNKAAETWIETTVAGPTTLYFSYRVKSVGAGPGQAAFTFMGGQTLTVLSPATFREGDTGWREMAVTIPSGNQAVRWKFLSGGYPQGGTPYVRGFVDQVWTANDGRPRVTDVATRAATWGAPFSWQVPIASSTTATLFAVGLPPGLTVDAQTHVISGTPTEGGRFEATLAALNSSGQHVAKVKFEVEPGLIPIPEGADAPGLVFTQPAPGTSWRGAGGLGHDGVDSVRGAASPSLAGSDNTLSTVFNGPGSLSFWYRCEALEANPSADFSLINLYVGIPLSSQPSQQLTATSWTQVTVPLLAGPQTVSWKALWARVFGSDVTQRYVYLDELAFAPSTVPPQPTFAAWQTAWNVVGRPTSTDDDGDGLTLPMEYAFGGSPYRADPELLPVTSISDGYLTIDVIKAPSPTDLFYFVQGSKDFAPNSWTTSTVEVLDEDGTHIVARSKKPVTEQPIAYLRVRVLVSP